MDEIDQSVALEFNPEVSFLARDSLQKIIVMSLQIHHILGGYSSAKNCLQQFEDCPLVNHLRFSL